MSDEIDAVEVKNGMRNMAELLAAYMRELRSQGFSRREALAITISWQAIMLQGRAPDE